MFSIPLRLRQTIRTTLSLIFKLMTYLIKAFLIRTFLIRAFLLRAFFVAPFYHSLIKGQGSKANYARLGLDQSSTFIAQARLGLENFRLKFFSSRASRLVLRRRWKSGRETETETKIQTNPEKN